MPIIFKEYECASVRTGVEPSFMRWIWMCSAWVMTSGGTKSCSEQAEGRTTTVGKIKVPSGILVNLNESTSGLAVQTI